MRRERALSASAEPPVPQRDDSLLWWLLKGVLGVVLIIGGFFAVSMGYLYFFNAP